MSSEVPSLSMDFDHGVDDYYGVNKIDEASLEGSETTRSDTSPFSVAYDDGWENAASYADMKFKSEEMNHLLKLEESPTKDKIMKLDYAAEHLFPQWIIDNKDWKSTQSKKNENKISDILQIQYANRSVEQTSTLIHWLMSVWQTAYMLGYKRCGQMFKVFHFLTYKPGTDVIVENERGLTFYIVISGTATVHKDGIGVVATITKGMSFGELALTEGNDVRSATVRAHTELELLRLHKVDYDHFVKDIQLAERRENLLVLRDCKIFDNWPRSKIQKMCTTCTRKTFKPGDVIFRQGDVPDCIYFIIDGKVSINKEIVIIVRNRWPTGNNEWDGVAKKRIQPHPVDELERGNFFGELSIIKNKRRTATAQAVTRCVLLCLDKLEFVHLLRSGRAMETVSSFASRYRDDKEILTQTAILNGGPSTTAQLNEYIKSMDQTSGGFNQPDGPARPHTADARTRNTVVTRLEDDEEKNFSIHGTMKYSVPSREVRRTMRAASLGAEGGGDPGPALFQPRHTAMNSKLDKKHKGKLSTGDMASSPEEEVDEHDEAYKKMKLKNENKAASVLAERMKSKLDPLKQNNQKQIKESQLQHMMHEIILANRKLAYLDEMAAVNLNQPAAKKEVVSKTEAAAKGKKLGFAASRRKSISHARRSSVDNKRVHHPIVGPGGGHGSPTKQSLYSAGSTATSQTSAQHEAIAQQIVFTNVTNTKSSPMKSKSKKHHTATPHIDFKDKQVLPMMGAIKSVMLESHRGRNIKSNNADDIAKYVESTTTGNTQAMPVGQRFTRQNTRDLTEMLTHEITSNTPAVHIDPVKASQVLESRKLDAKRGLEKQQSRKILYERQGSLNSLVK
mmetsp:Transcript_15434/g.29053  ORF Transcript_15434/g.29053 Transcript_15434/m.29053 type:complete len:848 (-) Transcript_15434:296-2839(-)